MFIVCRLQDGDDGFFEKFGSFLRQKSQLDENVFKTSLAPFSEEEGQEEEENESIITKVNDGSCTDSGLETKIDDTESFDTSTLSSEPDLVSVDNIKENVCMNVSIFNFSYMHNQF